MTVITESRKPCEKGVRVVSAEMGSFSVAAFCSDIPVGKMALLEELSKSGVVERLQHLVRFSDGSFGHISESFVTPCNDQLARYDLIFFCRKGSTTHREDITFKAVGLETAIKVACVERFLRIREGVYDDVVVVLKSNKRTCSILRRGIRH